MSTNPLGGVNRMIPGLIEGVGSPAKTPLDSGKTEKTSFSDLMADFVGGVNDQQKLAAEAEQAFLSGDPIELHEVMIKAEEAGISMELLLQIRNRLVSGINEIMRMPM